MQVDLNIIVNDSENSSKKELVELSESDAPSQDRQAIGTREEIDFREISKEKTPEDQTTAHEAGE